MKKLSHEDRGTYSNLMRAFLYDSIEKQERQPWETVIWISKWPELSDFLCDSNSKYGSTKQEYDLLMEQFCEVQGMSSWMKKAFYYYIKENAPKYGLEPPPSMTAFFLPKIIVVLGIIAVIIYIVLK